MKDPEQGGLPPGGASVDVLPDSGGTAPPEAAADERSAGPPQEARGTPDNRPRGKKRRKRRRGRKVFARDGFGTTAAVPGASTAGASISPTGTHTSIAGALRTPTPYPSPQGGGGISDVAALHPPPTILAEAPASLSPSPLRGGVRGGGAPARESLLETHHAAQPVLTETPPPPPIHNDREATVRPWGNNPARGPLPETRPRYDPPVFAALDLGTNNCRLLVAIPTRPGQFRVVDAFSRIVRLGEGLSTSGRLGKSAMDRAVDALKVCAEKLAQRRVRRSRLIATEACRSAENGEEFLERVKAETGLELEIIDRETEARLAVSGCGSLIGTDTDGVVLFDIGGGSSEVALVDVSGPRSPRLAEHIVAWTSLPVGVVSLAERFGGREVTRNTFGAMVDYVADLLVRFEGRGSLGRLASGPRFHLLGTSGTVTTLAGVHLNLERYDRRRVDGLWMDGGNVDAMIERLLSWDFSARVANPCIGADRADLVLGGCAILEAIRAVWPSERLRVADRGLREGILSELMGAEGVWGRSRERAPQ